MLSQLLEGEKKPKAKTPSKKSKGKRKEGESSSSAHTEKEKHSNSESSKPPSEEGGNLENGSTHSKRMNNWNSVTKLSPNGKASKKQEWSDRTRPSGILSRTLLSLKLQPYMPSMAKGHRTSTYTTSSLRQGM